MGGLEYFRSVDGLRIFVDEKVADMDPNP